MQSNLRERIIRFGVYKKKNVNNWYKKGFFTVLSILDLTAIMSDIFRLADARTNYNEKKFSGFLWQVLKWSK